MFTLDDIYVYILSWKKVNANSLQLYHAIQPIVRHTYIVNCDETWSLDPSIQHIQLDDSCYYGAQFNTAIKHVPPTALLCIVVGDNKPDNVFSQIFESTLRAFQTGKIGVYAVHDKRSTIQRAIRLYSGSLYHVNNTDCGFWCIHPTIHASMKDIEYTSSKYGWGIDIIVIKEARRRGFLVVRDESVSTDQLDHTCGYDMAIASKEAAGLIRAYNKSRPSRSLPFLPRR